MTTMLLQRRTVNKAYEKIRNSRPVSPPSLNPTPYLRVKCMDNDEAYRVYSKLRSRIRFVSYLAETDNCIPRYDIFSYMPGSEHFSEHIVFSTEDVDGTFEMAYAEFIHVFGIRIL